MSAAILLGPNLVYIPSSLTKCPDAMSWATTSGANVVTGGGWMALAIVSGAAAAAAS